MLVTCGNPLLIKKTYTKQYLCILLFRIPFESIWLVIITKSLFEYQTENPEQIIVANLRWTINFGEIAYCIWLEPWSIFGEVAVLCVKDKPSSLLHSRTRLAKCIPFSNLTITPEGPTVQMSRSWESQLIPGEVDCCLHGSQTTCT